MSNWLRLSLLSVVAGVLTILFIPAVRRLAVRWSCVSQPSAERWHRRPTPSLGGVAFFISFIISVVCFSSDLHTVLPLLSVATLAFCLGLYDDRRRISPAAKLSGQIVAAVLSLCYGYSLHFFTWWPCDAILTVGWIIGLTNAVNLLDNMDGLAGGIGLIAALYLALLFHQNGDSQHTIVALALSGAVAGFLLFNFYPASIFMGDAGSLFLGSTLSLLAVHAHGQASNVLSLVAIPTLILLVPILDTALVSITRLRRGQAVSQGGRDHSSHRLVILGLSEPRAVLLLYGMATLSGAVAIFIEEMSYTLSLTLVPVVVLALALFTAYLAQVDYVVDMSGRKTVPAATLSVRLIAFAYRRRVIAMALDGLLIAFCYSLALLLCFDAQHNPLSYKIYFSSLSVVVVVTCGAFWLCGVYQGVWHYTGPENLVRLAKGVVGGTVFSVLAFLFVHRVADYSRLVFLLYPPLLFCALVASRCSFHLFALLIRWLQPERTLELVDE